MSQLLIQQYLNQLADLRKVSGTNHEMVVREGLIRPAFRPASEDNRHMLTPVVREGRLSELDSAREDLRSWLARPPEERLAAVELLRRQMHGTAPRLQRTARVVQRARG